MGILDGIVEWIAEQVMHGLDLINTSVLGALGCDMTVFLRYFPAAETMYEVFVALAIGLILLIWIWNLVKNFALGMGTEAEDPVKLSIRSVVFTKDSGSIASTNSFSPIGEPILTRQVRGLYQHQRLAGRYPHRSPVPPLRAS